MALGRFMLWSHRWLGLVFGAVLAVLGLTGALVLLPLPEAVMKVMSDVHVNLGGGRRGAQVAVLVSAIGVLLELGGLYLWWRTKSLKVRLERGVWLASYDLHHVVGVGGLLIMGLLAATAVARVFLHAYPPPEELYLVTRATARLHTSDGFPWPLQVVWALGSLGFVLQAVTGVVMWWRLPSKARS